MKKIKNSVMSISPDAAVILMCLGILIACPLRIFQMLRNVDPITGFYNDYGDITITILYALLGVVTVLILVLTYLSGRIPASIAPQGRRIPLGIASLIFAATLFYDAISTYFSRTQSTATIIQNARTVSMMHHMHAIFAFLSTCFFVVFAISYLTGKPFHKKLKLLSLAPLAWSVIKVLERITVIISIMRVSELFLELAALIFLMIFFLSFARIVSEVNNKGTMWSTIACGCVASLVILAYTIPRLMLGFTGNTESLVSDYPVSIADIGCVILILVFIVTALRRGYSAEDVAAMEAAIERAQSEEQEISEEIIESDVTADSDGNIIIARIPSQDEDEQ